MKGLGEIQGLHLSPTEWGQFQAARKSPSLTCRFFSEPLPKAGIAGPAAAKASFIRTSRKMGGGFQRGSSPYSTHLGQGIDHALFPKGRKQRKDISGAVIVFLQVSIFFCF